MRTAFSQAAREGQQERLRTLRDLDAAAQVLASACQIILDEAQDVATIREQIYAQVSAEHLHAAVTTVGELTRPPDDTYAQELLSRHLMMRRFLPSLLHTLEFDATPGGRPTFSAVQFLQRIEGRPRASMQAAPREVIPRAWQRYVLLRSTSSEQGRRETRVDRPAYTVCVVERLHEALRRHDVFVDPRERWGDSRTDLSDPWSRDERSASSRAAWRAVRGSLPAGGCPSACKHRLADRAAEWRRRSEPGTS